jgi:predicted nucleic acid-binding protein
MAIIELEIKVVRDEPALLANELASVCRKKIIRYPHLRDRLLGVGLSLDIERVAVDHIAVVELALEAGLTTYDATYLWLARELETPLLTFDETLRRHVGV